jgi:hypothetical protein
MRPQPSSFWGTLRTPPCPFRLLGRYPLQRSYGGSVICHRLCAAAAILTSAMTPSSVPTPVTLQRPTVQHRHGSCRLSIGLRTQASPTPPEDFPGRCDFSASSLFGKAESSSLAFGTSLLPRDTPHPASRRRSSPRLPASDMSQADSDLHWLVSWFHQRTERGASRCRRRLRRAPNFHELFRTIIRASSGTRSGEVPLRGLVWSAPGRTPLLAPSLTARRA